MAEHKDCRFYQPKYPEVDDVVMVQVGRFGSRQAAAAAPGRPMASTFQTL